ncbi:MAG: class II aldolase/adducin family protein, partial [Pseudomonadota bacterium]
RCVLHTHMPNTTALTCLTDPRLRCISQNSLRFYDDVSYDHAYNGLAEDMDEGHRIAATLGDKRVLFMGNHGVIVTGPTIADAFDRLYYLERAAELQVLAMSTGQPLAEIPDPIAQSTRAEFDAGGAYADAHWEALLALLEQDVPGWSC